MKINIVNSLSEDKWHHFVDCQPAGNIFHTPEMFEVFSRTKGCNPILWAVVQNNTEIIALLTPVQITLMNGLAKHFTTRAISFGSVLHSHNEDGQFALSFLLNQYNENVDRSTMFTELRNLSDLSAIQSIMHKTNFHYEDHLNYLIDLNHSDDEILANMGQRTRKHIRRGIRRKDVSVEVVKDRNQLATCYELIQQSYQEANVPLLDCTLFEAAFDILLPLNMIRFTLAYVDNTPAATSVELIYKDTIYGWYGGVDRTYSSHVPGEMIMWEILKWGANNGYRVYDFGGAGKPDEEYGVRDFKAKFGGNLVNFGRNISVHAHQRLKLSKLGYRLLRGILS